jgi:hypothetical protein
MQRWQLLLVEVFQLPGIPAVQLVVEPRWCRGRNPSGQAAVGAISGSSVIDSPVGSLIIWDQQIRAEAGKPDIQTPGETLSTYVGPVKRVF